MQLSIRSATFIVLIAGTHIGALWALGRFAPPIDPAPANRTMSLIFLRAPTTLTTRNAPAPHPAPRSRAHEPSRTGTAAGTQTQQQVTDLQSEQPMPSSQSKVANLLEPVKPGETDAGLRERVLSQAREMAHEMAPRIQITPALSRQDRLAQGIAAAFKPRTTTFEELRAADGSPITKVSGPAGTYCIMRDTNLGTGHDTIRDGVRDKIVKCPR